MSRKILLTIILTLVMFTGGIISAQETADDKVYDPNRDTTVYENYIEKVDENITLHLMYNHLNKNLIIVYTICNKEWNEGDAFITVRNRINTFMIEHGFYHYKDFSDDNISYYSKKVKYTRFVYFIDDDIQSIN